MPSPHENNTAARAIDLDVDALLKRCQGSAATLTKLLDLCMSQAVKDADALRAALDNRDAAGAMISAHNIRGMASIIGANRLRDLAASIEDSGEAGNLQAIRESGDELNLEVRRCMDTIRDIASDVQSLLRGTEGVMHESVDRR